MISWIRRLAALSVLAGPWLVSPLIAEEAAGDASEPADEVVEIDVSSDSGEAGSSLSFSAGVDFATAYFYRGIPQETKGYIFQPYAGVGLGLLEATDDLPVGLSLSFGTWNSLHSQDSSDPWYESDFSAGATVSLPRGVEVGLSYVYLYGPSAGDIFAEEIVLSLGVDEKALLGLGDIGIEGTPITDFSISPSALIAFEVDGGSDGLGSAGDLGTYLELGIAPAMTVEVSKDYPVELSIPLTLGLGLEDYYEDSLGRNDGFGFFDVALAAGFPLSFIPERFGSWSLSASIHFLFLGQAAENIGRIDFLKGGDDFNVYGTVGISVE